MLTQEMQTALTTAEAMAGRLITLPGVTDIHLAPVAHHLDSPAIPLNPFYRLMLVVDDKTAENYRERLVNPHTVEFQDGTDTDCWLDERPETALEALFELLDADQDAAFPPSVWNLVEADDKWWKALENLTVLDMLDEIGLVLVPANWYDDIVPYTSLKRRYMDNDETFPVYNAAEWVFATINYQVFDRSTGTFSNR